MVTKKPSARSRTTAARTSPEVVAYLDALDHPLKKAVEALRKILLGASPEIGEEIKWNAPSFKTSDHFATLNLRARDGAERVWLILHTGAKKKTAAKKGLAIEDPSGLLEWLAKDRALVTFADERDVRAKRKALEAIVRQWIRQL